MVAAPIIAPTKNHINGFNNGSSLVSASSRNVLILVRSLSVKGRYELLGPLGGVRRQQQLAQANPRTLATPPATLIKVDVMTVVGGQFVIVSLAATL